MKIKKELSQEVLSWYFRSTDPASECEELPNGMLMRKVDRKFYKDFDGFIRDLMEWEVERTEYLKNHPDFKNYSFIH